MRPGVKGRGWRSPPDPVLVKGIALAGRGAVRSSVFHVESESGRFLVHEEELPGGGADLACSCAARGGCEHVAAVLAYLAANVPQVDTSIDSTGSRFSVPPSGDELRSDTGLTIAPPPSFGEGSFDCLHGDERRIERVLGIVREVLRATIWRGSAGEAADPRTAVEKLEHELEGVIATDVVRVMSELRSLALGAVEDPERACAILERVHAVIQVLEAAMARVQDQTKGGLDEKMETAFLGRQWAFDETRREEDVALLEVARTSALTPFGIRRNAFYLLDLSSGRIVVEQSFELAGESAARSPGPFPRRIHAGLLTALPGISPEGVRLMQYVLLPSAGESDLLRLKKASLTSARDVLDRHAGAAKIALGPYPVFLPFAPAGIVDRADGAGPALVDADGAPLALAHRISPEICDSVKHLASRHKLHCLTGLAVWDGHEIVLDPLSALIEHARGLTLLRLR